MTADRKLDRLPHKQRTIEKIQNAKIVDRLIDHFNGKVELTQSQCNVGIALIKKHLPDMKAVEHSGSIETKPEKMTEEELDAAIKQALAGTADGKKA